VKLNPPIDARQPLTKISIDRPINCQSTSFLLEFTPAINGRESWTLRKNEETTHLDAFETKGLREILRVSWTAKKTNEWVLNKAGVKRELLDTAVVRKLAYHGHALRKQGERDNH